MPDPVNAIYQLYNGTNWIEYHFTTNASQVANTTGTGWRKFVSNKTKVNGVAFAESQEAGGASVTITGAQIDNGLTGNHNYLSNNQSISASLVLLDTAVKQAYDHVPSNVLTYGDNGTFNSQYECLNQFEDFVTESYFTGAGFIKIKASNNNDIFYELDQTEYVPATRTVNSKQLNGNVTLYGTDIAMSNSNNTTLKDEIDNVRAVAEGKTKTYAITITPSGSDNPLSSFNSQNDSVAIEGRVLESLIQDANFDSSNLKIGDVILLTNTDLPDRWYTGDHFTVSGRGEVYTFAKMETAKIDLVWSAIQNKPTTLAGYGITDCSINSSTGAISIGGVTKTPLYTHQSLAGVVPYTGATGNVNLGNYKLSAKELHASDKIYGAYDISTDGSFTLVNIGSIYQDGGSQNMYIELDKDNNNNYMGDVIVRALNMTFNGKNVATITVASSAPSSPRIGDVWIKTA